MGYDYNYDIIRFNVHDVYLIHSNSYSRYSLSHPALVTSQKNVNITTKPSRPPLNPAPTPNRPKPAPSPGTPAGERETVRPAYSSECGVEVIAEEKAAA